MPTTTAWTRSGAGILSNIPATPFVREDITISSTVTAGTAVTLGTSYDAGNIDLFLNGTLLLGGNALNVNDYYAPGGLSVYFNADLLADDILHVQHYTTHPLSDTSFIQRKATQTASTTRVFTFLDMNDTKPILAFYKGILLTQGSDYTRSGSTFTLDNNVVVAEGDVLTLFIHGAYNVAEHFAKTEWADGSITQTIDLRNATVYPTINSQQPFIKASTITKSATTGNSSNIYQTSAWSSTGMIAGNFTLSTAKPILFISWKFNGYTNGRVYHRIATATDSGFTQNYQYYPLSFQMLTAEGWSQGSQFNRFLVHTYDDNYAWATQGQTIYIRLEHRGGAGSSYHAHYVHDTNGMGGMDHIMVEEYQRAT